jgi:oxygen-independent coproporphyrinogen-3 oxidase
MLAERFGRQRVCSIYIGGGTPSLLEPAQIERIIGAARRAFYIDLEAEITMEANPGTVSRDSLRAYRAAGVNRLSIGVQAAQDDILERIGRAHKWKHAECAANDARAAGFRNISFDVMAGLPGQTLSDLAETLRRTIALEPEHMSCYELTLEANTPMGRARPALPDEDALIAMSTLIARELRRAGLYQYEISNYARQGFACRHNIGYWLRARYLGVGPAAHSFFDNKRFANARSIDAWLARIERGCIDWEEFSAIPPEEARFESMMLGLRLTDGVDADAFAESHGAPPIAYWKDAMTNMRSIGWLNWNSRRVWLTPRGRMLHNAVCVRLL